VTANDHDHHPPGALIRFERIFAAYYFPIFHKIEFRRLGKPPETGPLIVTSNHPSFWDPWIIGMGLRRYIYWMAWEEAFSWPVIGRLITAHQAVPVDIDKPKPSTLRRSRAVLDAGHALGVFPEGERTHKTGGKIDPFKPGLAWMAFATGAPVLPVSIRGGLKVWPRGRTLPRPGKLRVTYHPVVDPSSVLPEAPRREREVALTRLLERTVESEV
jgi:1-acyl-sn-glycerol-3-phosphate acyltransferase